MDQALQEAGRLLLVGAKSGSLTSGQLQAFAGRLEASAATGGQASNGAVTADDTEWFRLFLAVQKKVENCVRGQDFGLPDGDWRSNGIQFEKMQDFYDGLVRVGAVRNVSWSFGGGAFVDAVDLRPIKNHLSRQVIVRLRDMGFENEPLPAAVPSPEPIKTKGPGPLRRFWLWLSDQIAGWIIGALLTLALAALLGITL